MGRILNDRDGKVKKLVDLLAKKRKEEKKLVIKRERLEWALKEIDQKKKLFLELKVTLKNEDAISEIDRKIEDLNKQKLEIDDKISIIKSEKGPLTLQIGATIRELDGIGRNYEGRRGTGCMS